MTSPIHESYGELVQILRELGRELIPATAAQYEAPPASGASREKNDKGVKNPTLEIVLDPRREAVSAAIRDVDNSLRHARNLLAPHVSALQSAVGRWEGRSEGPTA